MSRLVDLFPSQLFRCKFPWAIVLIAMQLGATPQFDFTRSGAAKNWRPTHDVGPIKVDNDGLVINITGNDPFIEGPGLKVGIPKPVQLRVRLKSESTGLAHIFWSQDKHFKEGHSVHFPVDTNNWTEVSVPLPSLEKGTRFRFDPPGKSGTCTIAWLRFEEIGATGITQITATDDELKFTYSGLADEFDLVEIAPFQPLGDAASAPVLTHVLPDKSGMVSVPRFDETNAVKRDRIYSAFVPVLVHPKSGRVPAAGARFVDGFSDVSKYEAPFPVSKSKKGLQIQMPDDALKLGVQHAAINVNLNSLVDLTKNPANLEWIMDGETYYFHRNQIENMPVKQLSDAGCTVAMIILSYESGDPAKDALMLHPKRAAVLPNHLAAFNTVTPDGVRYYKACLEFLADRFSRPDSTYGRVANYIIGNEVTSHWEWFNVGPMPGELVVAEYERAVRIAHTAIKKFSTSSRVYLSIDHHWSTTYGNDPQKGLAGRRLLDEFSRRARMGGDFDWHLAHHPYPENLFEPRTWLDKTAVSNFDSPRITFKNLEQLTRYFRRPEMMFDGQPRRIILSEQGFHSDNTEAGDAAQAAAYCYAWTKVSQEDGIDSFILHRHVDHSGEGGLNLGLWRRQPNSIADPSTPRPMYEVFMKADTPEREEAFRFALPVIGIKSWKELDSKR